MTMIDETTKAELIRSMACRFKNELTEGYKFSRKESDQFCALCY